MSGFWLAAAILVAGALAFVAVPLYGQRRATGRWPLAGIAAAALLVPGALGLYAHVSNWSPPAAPADSGRAVDALAARLARAPDDPAGWQALGRRYLAKGDAAKARDAYREAWARSAARDTELELSLAEAEALADRASLGGAAGQLLEEVLASEPDNPKALWYGGLAAFDSGREDLAKERWSKLLTLDPPAEIRERLATQWGIGAPLPATAATTIDVDVRLGAGVSPPAGATLFIFARAPGGGPPVAAIRRPAAELPARFTLRDADSMISGRKLSDFPALTVVARLSTTGAPTEQPGDVYAQADASPGARPVDLVIDRVVR